MTPSEPTPTEVEEGRNHYDNLVLFDLARRAKQAYENRIPLEVSPDEYQVLRRYCADPTGGMWESELAEAFRDSLPHVLTRQPWEPASTAAFGSLPVVLRAQPPT